MIEDNSNCKIDLLNLKFPFKYLSKQSLKKVALLNKLYS